MTGILLVDNYDSFTYNLCHQLARVSGIDPLVVRNDALSMDGVRALAPEAIVLSPGPGHPAVPRDVGVCAEILAESDVPVLGVCLGHQALVHAAGGEIGRIDPVHGRASEIMHCGGDLFAGVPQGFQAVRYNSLGAVGRLPDALELTAWTADGVPMAVRHRKRPAWGVQFHPESIRTAHGDRLIANFLELAGVGRPPRTRSRGRRRAAVRTPRARVHHRVLADAPAAEDVFTALYGDAATAFWLDSSQVEPGRARYSFIGAAREGATSLSYDAGQRRVTLRRGRAVEVRQAGVFDVLAEELGRLETSAPGLDLPFVGGFVGYFGYEVKADLGSPGAHRSALPDAQWLLADRMLAFDHEKGVAYAVALAHDSDDDACRAWLDAVERDVRRIAPAPPPAPPEEPLPDPLVLRLDRTPDEYLRDIGACLDAIRAGQSYELCLTAQASTAPVSRPLDLYRVLRRVSPAPYAAYLRWGDTAVLCSSPERFLRLDADRVVTSKPIKGTAPREPGAAADEAARELLRGSVKDRSENLMIVDLLRNDLGRVCATGTVEVPVLMDVESYATVHQLVSTVCGRLADGLGAVDGLRAAFPGGSMTGAPKPRSMEILDGLERGARGVYSGSLGYLSADGRADLNIVIRTAVTTPDRTTVGIGGAIVALSDPRAELDEIVLKAQGIVRALLAWQGRPYAETAFAVEGPELRTHV
ncbi:aminodeoxychorismate synthase component I [Actinomadura fibrosa]|uniref:aminodeoxychorismate synthase n=1 Tax=Actinomadura fibrosa TaxID=111802 RepID=A0ABW2XU53_9ACTN|nr:aminodeoxychorismate synthase component I [Actinomadura fibrosa]